MKFKFCERFDREIQTTNLEIQIDLLCEGTPDESVGSLTDDAANGVAFASEVALDCLLTERVYVVVANATLSFFNHGGKLYRWLLNL